MREQREIQIRSVVSHYAVDGIESPTGRYGYRYLSADPRLPFDARSFWDSAGLEDCCGGVVAWRSGKVVGFCRYNLYDHEGHYVDSFAQAQILAPAGTWIHKRYRHQGLATRMWRLVLRRLKPGTWVDVIAVSALGQELFRKLEHQYPGLRFDIDRAY